MDYDWLHKRLDPFYCYNNGRPGSNPGVLINMVLLQHLYGIPSMHQTYERINDALSYHWFLGYGLLENIPHLATVSYTFCTRFPDEMGGGDFRPYKGQKIIVTHIWQEYLDILEQLRTTERGKQLYALRKQTIERVFADAKGKHTMCYTHHRGLASVTR